jgi:hypothetical protein
MSSVKETNYEKFMRYSTKTDIKLDVYNNLRVSFEGGTYETLRFIGEFQAQINELSSQVSAKLNADFSQYPEQFIVRVYKHLKGGEVITIRIGEGASKNVYNYFESIAEMGMLFGGTFRYVLFEKTLANTLHATAPGQYV